MVTKFTELLIRIVLSCAPAVAHAVPPSTQPSELFVNCTELLAWGSIQ